LGSKPMRTLGDWSFSIYLTHQPLLFTLFAYVGYRALGAPAVPAASPPPATSLLAGWGECGLFIAVVLVVSSLTYRYVELPARQHINAWARRGA
jgi:peptidoglycan/LPS O-acetylase OafA/YrhL